MKKKFYSDNVNDVLNIFNCILKEDSIYSIEEFSLAFLALSQEEKQQIYIDKDFLDNTCIMDAIDHNKPHLAFTLIDLGFDPNISNIKGVNPLINAIINKQEDLALALIELTHNLDFARSSNGVQNGDTALIYACDKELPHIVKKLVDCGADIFYKNEFQQNALFYCLKNTDAHLESFEILLPLYKEKAFIHNISGMSVLEYIFRNGSQRHLDIIASQGLEFNNLKQKDIDRLKETSVSSYSSGKNSYSQYMQLVNYWDKMKEVIKINNKFNSQSIETSKVKQKTIKI